MPCSITTSLTRASSCTPPDLSMGTKWEGVCPGRPTSSHQASSFAVNASLWAALAILLKFATWSLFAHKSVRHTLDKQDTRRPRPYLHALYNHGPFCSSNPRLTKRTLVPTYRSMTHVPCLLGSTVACAESSRYISFAYSCLATSWYPSCTNIIGYCRGAFADGNRREKDALHPCPRLPRGSAYWAYLSSVNMYSDHCR